MNVHILGAASGIGKWFVERVFVSPPPQVFAYDINPTVTRIFAARDHVTPVVIAPETEMRFAFETEDIVLLSVPEQALPQLCQQLKPSVPAGLLVVVMTSRQTEPMALMAEVLPEARVLGMHPLFGPQVASPHGQSVVFCSGQAELQWSRWLAAQLTKAGIRVMHRTPEVHDRDMGYVQALTHFVFLVFSYYLKLSDQTVEDLMQMRTPPFQFLLAFSSRVLMQSPATLAAIQTAEGHQTIREGFLEAVQTLDTVFSDGDMDRAEKAIADITQLFSLSSLEDWTYYSELAVSASQERDAFFHEKCASRMPVVFRTGESSEYRVGLIEAVEISSLQLTEFTTRVEADSTQDGLFLVPCPTGEQATDAYRKQGVHVKTQPVSIKKKHIEVLSNAQAAQWLNQHVLPLKLVHVFDNPMHLSDDFVTSWVVKLIYGVKSCQCLDVYKKSKLTLHFLVTPDLSEAEVLDTVQRFLSGEPAPPEKQGL